LSEAQVELAKLDARPTGAPLLDELRSFLKRYDAVADAGTKAAAVAMVEPQKLGKLDTSAPEEPRGASGATRSGSSDFRRLLQEAASAFRAGDLGRAEQLYDQVLAVQPGNTEALSGLGDIARRRNDPTAAAVMYDQVLAENPGYLPALIARADQQWESGNRKAALTLYKRIVEQASPSTDYAQRAASRLAQGEGERSNDDSPKPAESEQAPAAPAPEAAPEIDTTDLPGFK
jgi:predicted Zn-dependent protease